LTGVEAATALATRLREIAVDRAARITLADQAPRIASITGEGACRAIFITRAEILMQPCGRQEEFSCPTSQM